MPKIIDGLQKQILTEAKYQTFKNGYSKMTIRSVAKACDIAVGTIYNYYSSKDFLTASFILLDWFPVEEEIQKQCENAKEPMEVLQDVYGTLERFISEYRFLFEDKNALQSASTIFRTRHQELRHRLARMIQGVCMEKAKVASEFLPEFIAEAFLAWSIEAHSFNDLRIILDPLFNWEKGENQG
jgi:AcrR family transcriptional regulator